MKSERNLKPIIALALASMFWGATGPIMKLSLVSVPLFSLAFLRFSLASILMFPLVAKNLSIKKSDLLTLLLCAMLGITLHIPFFFAGLKLTTALNAGIIVASLPLFTLIAAHVFLREKISSKLIGSAVLGTLGISIIIGKDISHNGFSLSPLGDFLILLSTISFVGFEILSKKLFKTYHPLLITFYCMVIGAGTFLPGTIYESYAQSGWYNNLSGGAIGGIFYGILFSSFGAYALWQWGLSKNPASRVGFFFHLDPVVSTVVAVILLSETITLPFVIGSLLIFAALFWAEGRIPIFPLIHKHTTSSTG